VPIIGKSPEDDEERGEGDFYLDLLNYARSTFSHPSEVYDVSDRPGTRQEFDSFVRSYAEWKRTYGYYDFTDMLERAAKGGIRPSAEVVFVDEAQDLSPLQWAVVAKVCKGAHEVHLAGDDDQAIYTWAGADAHGMARFVQKHSGDHIVLSLSHRLPVAVHTKSQELIRRIVFRVDKEFSSKGHVGLVRVHGEIHSVPIQHGEDILLLGRTHSVLREVERLLIEQRVPYVRETGRPGIYQNKYATAVRAFRKLGRGERITDSERTTLIGVASEQARRLLDANDVRGLTAQKFYVALNIPHRFIDLYDDIDLDVKPTIRLSTIHASKGHEAHRVILLTDMTNRVAQNADRNPDDEIRVFYVGMTRAKHTLDIVEGHNGFNI